MKRGLVGETKTKSAVRRLARSRQSAVALALLTVWLAQVACSGGLIYPAELTATAISPGQLVSAGGVEFETPIPVLEVQDPVDPSPTPAPTRAVPTAAALAEPTQDDPVPDPTRDTTPDSPILYYTQAGDTLKGLSARFNVLPGEITSPDPIPAEGLFDPGILLLIPPRLGETSSSTQLIPDSEIVYSPSALDFELKKFVLEAGGYLTTYKEWRSSGWHDGPRVIERVGIENSINPRLLLAILEWQSHWVYGQPENLAETEYPIGFLSIENEKKGLYYQLSWAVQQLNIGYYGWRDGTVTELSFPDGSKLRLAPDLNAGTVALQYLFSRLYNQTQWAGILYGPDGLLVLYENMFDNPWMRAQTVEPLFPATLTQPPLELPFFPGRTWSYTGGPHSAWGPDGARAAVDFAPSTDTHGCYESIDWVTASSSGLVVRSENGVIVLDLDGDGYEQTGWAILYLHIATTDRAPLSTWVNLNDPIGHPSCEGGMATGTHVHMARKYNGEWILADGPMPMVLSGWRVHADPVLYMGTLTKDDLTVYSSVYGTYESRVTRPAASP